jgi:hypothetical protein
MRIQQAQKITLRQSNFSAEFRRYSAHFLESLSQAGLDFVLFKVSASMLPVELDEE